MLPRTYIRTLVDYLAVEKEKKRSAGLNVRSDYSWVFL